MIPRKLEEWNGFDGTDYEKRTDYEKGTSSSRLSKEKGIQDATS